MNPNRPTLSRRRALPLVGTSAISAWMLRLLIAATLFATLIGFASADEPANSSRRVDGYKGIWFTLGQFYGQGSGAEPYSKASRTPVFPYGDKYSGGLGTYTAKHTPLAIYCAAVDRTFFVYGGTTAPGERHLLCMNAARI